MQTVSQQISQGLFGSAKLNTVRLLVSISGVMNTPYGIVQTASNGQTECYALRHRQRNERRKTGTCNDGVS